MNYLAHALLSPANPYVLMGNLWGDLLRPKDFPGLHPDILAGVKRHRLIDAFTDQHAAVQEINALLRPYQGKYTPVVTDVLMDYILSARWSKYHGHAIEDFCQERYRTVERYLGHLPDRLHPRITRMLGHRWLESCKDRDRLEATLRMLARRASFDNHIPHALIPYERHQLLIDPLFEAFFLDLREHLILQNEG